MKNSVRMQGQSKATYLYAEENKELYRETLDQFNAKNCVFARNLRSHLELSQGPHGPFYRKHIKECSVCQKVVKDYSDKEKRVKRALPVVSAPDDLSETIRADLKESLEFLLRNKEEEKRKTFTLEFFQKGLKDFFMTMPMSSSFLKGAGIAVALWALFYF